MASPLAAPLVRLRTDETPVLRSMVALGPLAVSGAGKEVLSVAA